MHQCVEDLKDAILSEMTFRLKGIPFDCGQEIQRMDIHFEINDV